MGTGSMTSLKLADKHVREGNFAAALALIQKARSEDPSNRYAEAYEERVRSLMDSPVAAEGAADRVDANRASADQPSSPPPLAEIVGFLSRAYDALSNNDYLGALDILGQARQLDPTNADIPVLEEQIQAACSAPPTASTPDIHYQIVRDTIQAYIQEACDLASRGEFDEAIHLVARGFRLIDKVDASIEQPDVVDREVDGRGLGLLLLEKVGEVVGVVPEADDPRVGPRQPDLADNEGAPKERGSLQVCVDLPARDEGFRALTVPDIQVSRPHGQSIGVEGKALNRDLAMKGLGHLLLYEGSGNGREGEETEKGKGNDTNSQPE